MPSGAPISRRAVLGGAAGVALLTALPTRRVHALVAQTAASGNGRFLTAHELTTLRAVTARFVPGPPDDPDPGALEAHCAEAIDLYLGAFSVDPPLIYAGGPFSNRAGARHDDFADFIELDERQELGWRIRLEGSQGKKEREFAGPVIGLQQRYRDGLAHLDQRAQAVAHVDFAQLPAPAQDAILSDQTDGQTQDFVGLALADTLDAMYGPPEYGGNHDLVGWGFTHWPGDVQPRGFTPHQVSTPGPNTLAAPTAAATAFRRVAPYLAGRAAERGRQWLRRRPMLRG